MKKNSKKQREKTLVCHYTSPTLAAALFYQDLLAATNEKKEKRKGIVIRVRVPCHALLLPSQMSLSVVSFTNNLKITPSIQFCRLPICHALFSSVRLSPRRTSRYANSHSANYQFFLKPSFKIYSVKNLKDSPREEGKYSIELEQAREVVIEILQDLGVSKEESVEIAANSPKYVDMLMDEVRELDELSLWNSWSNKESDEGVGGPAESDTAVDSFKEKVYNVAIKKGDKGMLPFLESLGLNLSSAMHLGRYLASQILPNFILKVKYMKEILFSSNDNRAIGKNARRMMMHLSIPIDEELQQTMSFLQKIQARRGGLDSLDSGDSYFRYLIESFPRFLSLNVESKMMPKVEFLENSGVPKECMRNILLLFPPIIFYGVENGIKPRMRAFEKINMGDKDFGRMLVKYPWILSRSIQENCEEVLSFFEIHKVPKASVERAVKSWPHILGCSTRNLKMMVEQFNEFGITDKKLGQIIAKSPQLLLQKPKEFLRVVDFLEELELDEESVGKILAKCPEIFNTNIDNILKKKVEFLVDMGIPRKHLPRIIKKYPDLFVCDIDKTLHPRMKFLMQNGHLSKREVGVMVMKFSPILGYSIEEVLRPKLEFLMKTMKVSVTELVEYPRFFSYSLDKRIKPRFWVLKSRNLKCNLKDMLAKNDDEFATEFILSNPAETE